MGGSSGIHAGGWPRPVSTGGELEVLWEFASNSSFGSAFAMLCRLIWRIANRDEMACQYCKTSGGAVARCAGDGR